MWSCFEKHGVIWVHWGARNIPWTWRIHASRSLVCNKRKIQRRKAQKSVGKVKMKQPTKWNTEEDNWSRPYSEWYLRSWQFQKSHRYHRIVLSSGNSCWQHSCSGPSLCWVDNRLHSEGSPSNQLQIHMHSLLPSEGLGHSPHLYIYSM